MSRDPIAADSGVLLVGATHSFDETPSPDIILVPGGMTTFEHARDEKLLDWVRQAHQTAKWTASVCSGSVILAAAGLLKGKRATSHWMVVPMLKTFGVTPVSDERIVHEGDIVTCAGVSAGIDLAMWLAGQIGGEGTREGRPAGDRIRPAAAVRLRPHLQGVDGDQGDRDRAAVEGDGQTRTAGAVDAAALGPGAASGPVAAAPNVRFAAPQPR